MRFAALLLAVAVAPPAGGALQVEVYTDFAAFNTRLGGNVTVVGFDDIDTSTMDPVPFDADRYLAQGVRIVGEGGQFVSRNFGFTEFDPVSVPNVYSPGPIGVPSGGGNESDVTFVVNGQAATVAGVGVVFIDPDFPDFPSPGAGKPVLRLFDAQGQPLAFADATGPDGSEHFRGLVIVDDTTGQPASVVARAHVKQGSGWPGGEDNEGVALDDLAFGGLLPLAPPTTTTTTTTIAPATTTTTLAGGCARAASFASVRCRLATLKQDLQTSGELGKLKTMIVKRVGTALAKVERADRLATQGKKRPAKAALKQARGALRAFGTRIRSKAGNAIPDGTRSGLLAEANAVRGDLGTLQRSL